MSLPQSPPIGAERRRQPRHPTHCRVRLIVEGGELHGRAVNLSQRDVLFLTDDHLRVTAELMEDGVVKRMPGRLVRREPLADGGASWAVRFD